MRNTIVFYLNGKRHEASGPEVFWSLAEYLRYERSLTGTKIVCAEGDCGACSVLVSRHLPGRMSPYKSINSCISFVYQLDRCHVITVEGLTKEHHHPVQTAMVKNHGAQCGYCTPGFICAMASLTQDAKTEGFDINEKKAQNYLTGNLCRCTGYDSIVKAACQADLSKLHTFEETFGSAKIEKDLATLGHAVFVEAEGKNVYLPSTMDEATGWLSKKGGRKIVSGATDVGVQSNKRKIKINEAISLTGISELYTIREEKTYLKIGARVSLDEIEKVCDPLFPEFAKLLHVFASPQIKNSATLAGNIINASPIADTTPFLKVAEAQVVLRSQTGERVLNINAFYKPGYKQLDLRPDEILTEVRIPKTNHEYKLYKVSLRKDLDISAVTFAARYYLQEDRIEELTIALGGVGPSVQTLKSCLQGVVGKKFEIALFKKIAQDLRTEIKPQSDVRGSAEYRHLVAQNLMLKFCDEIRAEKWADIEVSL